MRFLINRTDAIGDTILTIPMAKMLKRAFPDCHITFLISARSSDLFQDHPYVDLVKVYHRKSHLYFKFKEIFNLFKEVKPTHYFYVGGGYLPNFIAWFLRVSFRGGLKSRWHTYITLNHGVRQKRSMVTMHEMEFNLNLLAPLGMKYDYKDFELFTPEIKLSEIDSSRDFENFSLELSKKGFDLTKKLIFIHPGMTGHTLNWSSRNYGRLIIKLNQKFENKFIFIVSHTPSDEIFLKGIREILNFKENTEVLKNVYFFNGAINGLRYYMSILQKAALFVGPSTGTTHIAAALNVPVVGIYSPIKVQSTKRWGPIGKSKEKIKIIVPDVICGEPLKCALKDCPYFECMGKIEVEDVIKLAIIIMDL